MAFSDQERVDIRRFCGYPIFGGIATPMFGYRFSTQYGQLEYKLTNLSAAEESTLRATYLTATVNLYTLEAAIAGTSANLDTDAAAVWIHNKREQADREALFDSWRRRLCGFLGVPPGPALANGGNSIRVVV